MLEKPIAVLGGGNGGHTMAADLTLAGYKVNFYEHPLFKEKFKKTLETGRVEMRGVGRQGVAEIHKVTLDMEEAISDVELINLVIPALGHDRFFEEMIPFLQDGQTVVIWPDNYGSLRLRQLLEERAPEKKITIAGTNTLPYGTRLAGPAQVNLLLMAPEVIISALPAKETERILPELQELFPMLKPAQNVLAASFSNPNPIVHPAGSLLNTGRIQYSKGDFYLYREGITEAVARAIRAVYDETAALAEAFGFEVLQYEDRDFRTTTSIMGVAFQAPFDTIGVIASVIGPKSLQDRYIVEDVPYGLVPLSEFGKKLGVPTPVIDSLITIGSIVCDQDFWKTGRTLEELGLADMDKDDIIRLVEEG
ncbi:TPA: hypothetical protein EYP37_08785 [Candidatus Poribacteria bacterium]|nr:hypothetical protein [Candidatus Poribacteria bacterium]